jgi:Tfp pilus assembly protein PilN
MINLLPPELKKEYRYARLNHRLVEWVVAFVFGIIGVAVITGVGIFLMQQSSTQYQAKIASSQTQLENEHYKDVKQHVAKISRNLRLMVDVFSKEVLFSKLLTRLGNVTPSGAELTNLTISDDQQAINITADTTGYGAATQLQTNLSNPKNRIFSNADLISISCTKQKSGKKKKTYPCQATIRALLTKDSPFLFINAKKASTPS